MWVLWTIGAILVLFGGWLVLKWTAPKKCAKCGVPMRLLTANCGKTTKLEGPKCKHRVDTGIPTGRGRR